MEVHPTQAGSMDRPVCDVHVGPYRISLPPPIQPWIASLKIRHRRTINAPCNNATPTNAGTRVWPI